MSMPIPYYRKMVFGSFWRVTGYGFPKSRGIIIIVLLIGDREEAFKMAKDVWKKCEFEKIYRNISCPTREEFTI